MDSTGLEMPVQVSALLYILQTRTKDQMSWPQGDEPICFSPFQIHYLFLLLLLFLWKRCHSLWIIYHGKARVGKKKYFVISSLSARKSKNVSVEEGLRNREFFVSLN